MNQQAASRVTQGSSYQHSSEGSAAQAEAHNWQLYYGYAEQLYAAGDNAQADRYYEYARQLYDATLQARQPGAADANVAPQQVVSEATQKVPSPAGWEAYYNYAQELYAAGYQQQAEAYYQQAQQLYAEAEKQLEYQTAAVGMSHSVPPQYTAPVSDSYVPQEPSNASVSYMSSAAGPSQGGLSSYAPPQQSSAVAGSTATATAAAWSTLYADDEPVVPSGRSLKQKIKRWTVVIVISAAVIGIGGVLALFSYYKEQLRQIGAEKVADTSLMGRVKNATIQPMVDTLKPAFDKTLRLSDAAQPLLYELGLRDTPPPNLESNAADNEVVKEQSLVTPSAADPPTEPVAAPSAVSGEAQPGADSSLASSGNDDASSDVPSDAAAPLVVSVPTLSDEKIPADEQGAAPPSTLTKDGDESNGAADIAEDAKKITKQEEKSRSQGSAHRRRHSRRSARNRHSNSTTSQSDVAENKTTSPKKRSRKSGLSDDPLGKFSL